MIFGLDTNVLVRLLVRDDEKQVRVASERIAREVQKNNEFYVSNLVILETIWVLESCYDAPRNNIIEAIGKIMLLNHFKFDDIDTLHEFISLSKKTSIDLSDLLIGVTAVSKKCKTTLTFDKKASKTNIFELLQNS